MCSWTYHEIVMTDDRTSCISIDDSDDSSKFVQSKASNLISSSPICQVKIDIRICVSDDPTFAQPCSHAAAAWLRCWVPSSSAAAKSADCLSVCACCYIMLLQRLYTHESRESLVLLQALLLHLLSSSSLVGGGLKLGNLAEWSSKVNAVNVCVVGR